MPGAPDGFGSMIDFAGLLPCFVLLSISIVAMLGINLFAEPPHPAHGQGTWKDIDVEIKSRWIISSFSDRTTAQMGAHCIQGDLVRPDHLGYTQQQKCSEWSPKDVIVTGVKLNADPESEASVTVSFPERRVDDVSKMLIYNWKTNERADLDDEGRWRQRNIDLYPHPLPERQSLGIRAKLTRAVLPLPLFLQLSSRCGVLRCLDVILGKWAIALWIRPHDRAMVSHWEEHDGSETLIAAVFSAPLNPTAKVRICEVYMNSLNNWIMLDYDKDLGGITLGLGFGKIMIDIHAIASEDRTGSNPAGRLTDQICKILSAPASTELYLALIVFATYLGTNLMAMTT
ncbi:hypothetical protein ARMSODRAFT_1065477 [Armillaria solidipes]|uniref:Uncharacterized protein n=1 Tax=Armillaria solidipes TaxID=1076256 RepID=A0A2H3B4X7_9AGAR|nr:hypothetical protein ARMSODRAFT_1065477 [Armillaria solidipes]